MVALGRVMSIPFHQAFLIVQPVIFAELNPRFRSSTYWYAFEPVADHITSLMTTAGESVTIFCAPETGELFPSVSARVAVLIPIFEIHGTSAVASDPREIVRVVGELIVVTDVVQKLPPDARTKSLLGFELIVAPEMLSENVR